MLLPLLFYTHVHIVTTTATVAIVIIIIIPTFLFYFIPFFFFFSSFLSLFFFSSFLLLFFPTHIHIPLISPIPHCISFTMSPSTLATHKAMPLFERIALHASMKKAPTPTNPVPSILPKSSPPWLVVLKSAQCVSSDLSDFPPVSLAPLTRPLSSLHLHPPQPQYPQIRSPSPPPLRPTATSGRAGKELPTASSASVREVVLRFPSPAGNVQAARESGSPSYGAGLHHCSSFGHWWRPLSPSALLSVAACSSWPRDMGSASAGEITGLLLPKKDCSNAK